MTFHFKPPEITPELIVQIGELRSKIQISIGQTLLAMMDLPRYKHISLADFSHLVINPLFRNRVAIAHKSITESGQTKAGVFPLRLGYGDTPLNCKNY